MGLNPFSHPCMYLSGIGGITTLYRFPIVCFKRLNQRRWCQRFPRICMNGTDEVTSLVFIQNMNDYCCKTKAYSLETVFAWLNHWKYPFLVSFWSSAQPPHLQEKRWSLPIWKKYLKRWVAFFPVKLRLNLILHFSRYHYKWGRSGSNPIPKNGCM